MGRLTQRGLYLLAVVLWLFAGAKVLWIAVLSWPIISGVSAYVWLVVAFLFFSFLVFPRAVPPNVRYIVGMKGRRAPFYRCFRPASWAVMAFMISLGLTLRLSGWVGHDFIAGFYTGLGVSLLLCSVYYVKPIHLTYKYSHDG